MKTKMKPIKLYYYYYFVLKLAFVQKKKKKVTFEQGSSSSALLDIWGRIVLAVGLTLHWQGVQQLLPTRRQYDTWSGDS